MGGATVEALNRNTEVIFQSTLPVGGATATKQEVPHNRPHFNPRSPWGERLKVTWPSTSIRDFNPRSPWGERPPFGFALTLLYDFNPRSPWGERLGVLNFIEDMKQFQSTLPVGGATSAEWRNKLADLFQSTLPVGGATLSTGATTQTEADFNPRSPWGERLRMLVLPEVPVYISIHAPRGGSDRFWQGRYRLPLYFNPRSPWGERRGFGLTQWTPATFQSTLPVGGATGNPYDPRQCQHHFNPRSPWGERLQSPCDWAGQNQFQSTLPVGGATILPLLKRMWFNISIHAPRGGSDALSAISCPATP